MTQEEFEHEANEIHEMILNYYFIRDRGARKNFRRLILELVKQLLKI